MMVGEGRVENMSYRTALSVHSGLPPEWETQTKLGRGIKSLESDDA